MPPSNCGSRGHRVLPHTADVIVEGWGPDVAACVEEAVEGLVETYAEPVGAAVTDQQSVHVPAGPAEEMLVAMLDEVIFALDTADGVPVGARVSIATDGGLDAELVLAEADSVEPGGAVPKAISRSGLLMASGPYGVRCRFLVDV
jgi:SHS2 domain-containing protein